jgi:hypothetical protein
MKQISWIAGLIVLVVFSGCFDTLEEVTIAENGSGTFSSSLDMGKMLGLAKTMGSGKDEMKDIDKLKMDTVINLKDVQDSMKKLNAAEKKIAATGTLKILVDANEDKMNFTFTFPFSKASEIAGIQGVLKRARQDILDDIMQNIMASKLEKMKQCLGMKMGMKIKMRWVQILMNITRLFLKKVSLPASLIKKSMQKLKMTNR